jgi:NADPH:quinone reductase-like Zn-dependent oxidoreductase
MKRIQYHRYGGPEVMRFEDFEPGRPRAGEVSVRVRAAAANPYDWKIRNGEMKVMSGRKFPQGMGHDFAGVVEAVGQGVTRFDVGDAVLGAAPIRGGGAFADVVVTAVNGIAKKPAELTFEEAAAIPTVGVAALQAVVGKGKFLAGQSIFVHGCLGGVGRAAVQIALARGARTVGGSCRVDGAQDAHDLGVSPVVDFDCIPTSLSGRFDVVFDTVGTLDYATARRLLTAGGRIVDVVPSATKFVRSALPGPYEVVIARHNPQQLDELAQACAHRTLRLPIARIVPLEDAIPALTELELNHAPRGGKLIITMNQPY